MSFYSALVLAANDQVRRPTPQRVRSLLDELGLRRPDSPDYDIGNLTDDVTELFNDREALAQNARFFTPDSIGFCEGVEVEGPDCDYRGKGWAIHIHGNGYLFPWDLDDVRTRVLVAPKLVRLRAAMQEQFGGRFLWPARRPDLRERLIGEDSGWVWFMSESL